MNNAEVMDVMRAALMVVMKLSAPTLILSMAVGILISILQAATHAALTKNDFEERFLCRE